MEKLQLEKERRDLLAKALEEYIDSIESSVAARRRRPASAPFVGGGEAVMARRHLRFTQDNSLRSSSSGPLFG